jgi:hypothetical protein
MAQLAANEPEAIEKLQCDRVHVLGVVSGLAAAIACNPKRRFLVPG